MNIFFYLWMIIALFCIGLEIAHFGTFLFLSLAFGGLVSAFLSIYIRSFTYQCLLFLIASIASFVLFIMTIKKIVDTEHPYQKTNTQALVGQHAIVIKEISSDSPGDVKIGGELWMARSTHNQFIPAKSQVIIVHVKGAHVVVEQIK